MRNFLGSFFRSKPPRVIEDPALGSMTLRDNDWFFQCSVRGKLVEVSIPDADGSPCPEARQVLENSALSLESLWDAAVNYTVGQIAPLNPRFAVDPSAFDLEAISVHAPATFEGGELVFWFRIIGDENGSYFVPLHQGTPLLWHRDS